MPEMDQGIKWLVRHQPRDLLALVLPAAEYLSPMPEEYAAPQLLLDALVRVRYQGQECAVDFEAQARPDPKMGERLWSYAARVFDATGLRVISVVLWLQRHGNPPTSPFQMAVGDLLLGTWHFFGVELYKLDAEAQLKSGLLGLLPLVPFMHNGGNAAVLERAALRVFEQAPADQVGDLEALLATFGARAIGSAAMKAILRRLPMSTDLIKSSPLYQEWVEEGRAAGQEEEARVAVLLILRQRFTDLPSDVADTIQRTDLATLHAVLAHAVRDTLEQVRERLRMSPA